MTDSPEASASLRCPVWSRIVWWRNVMIGVVPKEGLSSSNFTSQVCGWLSNCLFGIMATLIAHQLCPVLLSGDVDPLHQCGQDNKNCFRKNLFTWSGDLTATNILAPQLSSLGVDSHVPVSVSQTSVFFDPKKMQTFECWFRFLCVCFNKPAFTFTLLVWLSICQDYGQTAGDCEGVQWDCWHSTAWSFSPLQDKIPKGSQVFSGWLEASTLQRVLSPSIWLETCTAKMLNKYTEELHSFCCN